MIELLLVVLIAAILASVAGPPMSNMIRDNRLLTAAQNIMGLVRMARTEAISRNQIVRVELQTDNRLAVCVVDAVNTACPGATDDDLLKALTLATDGVMIDSNVNLANGVAFTPRGRLASGGVINIGVCDDRGDVSGQFVQINQVGRSLHRKINTAVGDSCLP